MADEKNERLQGSFNHVIDLNRSLNSATSLLQTVSQSQAIDTVSSGNNNSNNVSGSGLAPVHSTESK